MAIVTQTIRASESSHWYTREGEPRYTVTGANGRERNTTLRDARKENLVPSVTTVIGIMAKPGLNHWMQRQVLLSALTLPKLNSETDDQFIDRIIEDSREQGRAAAATGTEIHAAIQDFYEGGKVLKHHGHVQGCVKEVYKEYGQLTWISEKAFAHDLGFGGKVDLHSPDGDGLVIDIKTKDFTEDSKVDIYDEHMLQLAAYRLGLGLPKAACANVFVSRNIPGLTKIYKWSPEDINRGEEMFKTLLKFWQLKHQHQ